MRQFLNLGTNNKEMAGNNDKILIEGIKKQDEKVIAEIYNMFFPSVRQYIYNNKGSLEDARDIFNDTIIVILNKAREDDLTLKCSLKTYIYAVSKNLWLKRFKTEKLETISYEEIGESQCTAELFEEETLNINHAHLLFQKHLARLNPTCRKILGYFLEGKTFKEITELLNIENEGYARKRKYRCVKLLIKRIMKDPDYNRIYDDEIR